MKATRILLRWYKSFNISYRLQGPARLTEQVGPWNRLHVGDKLQQFYPFIEIPLETGWRQLKLSSDDYQFASGLGMMGGSSARGRMASVAGCHQ